MHRLHFLKRIKFGISLSKKICDICFIKSPLKMMKNAFWLILKALFVLKIFRFLSWLFGHVEKSDWLIKKIRLNFKIHDVTTWLTNNCNRHIGQATSQRNLVNYYNITREIFFFKNYRENEAGRLVLDLLFFKKA